MFTAKPVCKSDAAKGNCEIKTLSYTEAKLSVELEFYKDNKGAEITFTSIIGFRLLDEGDLCDYWSEINLKIDWLFEVQQGGWLEFESRRDDFLSKNHDGVQEFLIISNNDCVNVICYEVPTIEVYDAT